MTTGKQKWSELVDDAYNRYAHNDTDLPRWFADDESKHNKKQLPVTKDMVNVCVNHPPTHPPTHNQYGTND